MATTPYVLFPPTGILAAIEMHRAAWDAYQVAPEGEDVQLAFLALEEMLAALVATPCRTVSEARALFQHLRWYVGQERHTRDWRRAPDSVALARTIDLALLLGSDPGELPGSDAVSLSSLAARVVHRLSYVGELAACAVILFGGMGLIGAASLVS